MGIQDRVLGTKNTPGLCSMTNIMISTKNNLQ